jgi:hypothetical protein
MQIWVLTILEFRVEVCVSCILAFAILVDVAQPSLESVVCVKSLQVCDLRNANRFSGFDEVVFGSLGPETSVGDVDRAVVAVVFFLSGAMVRFELLWLAKSLLNYAIGIQYLLQMRPHLIRCPTFCLPAIEIAPLCPCVHHEVDRTASTKGTSTRNDRLSVSELRCLVALVEQGRLCGRLQILEVENGVDDMWYIFVIGATFNDQDAEVGRVLSEACRDYATCCAT